MSFGDSYLSLGEIRNRRKAQNKEYYNILKKSRELRIKHTNLLFEEIDTLKKLTKELEGGIK